MRRKERLGFESTDRASPRLLRAAAAQGLPSFVRVTDRPAPPLSSFTPPPAQHHHRARHHRRRSPPFRLPPPIPIVHTNPTCPCCIAPSLPLSCRSSLCSTIDRIYLLDLDAWTSTHGPRRRRGNCRGGCHGSLVALLLRLYWQPVERYLFSWCLIKANTCRKVQPWWSITGQLHGNHYMKNITIDRDDRSIQSLSDCTSIERDMCRNKTHLLINLDKCKTISQFHSKRKKQKSSRTTKPEERRSKK